MSIDIPAKASKILRCADVCSTYPDVFTLDWLEDKMSDFNKAELLENLYAVAEDILIAARLAKTKEGKEDLRIAYRMVETAITIVDETGV